ncbi:MAG: peptidyl-prolyl cis-trans isomerase [Pseudomonadales bacterium]|nr:peptidyl-prolyl cis-trans isomerase [Pseudomonadales bacterium]
MKVLRTLLSEPLLYFLVLGVFMFAVYELVSDDTSDQQLQELVVSDGQINALISGFERVWQRLPTQNELDALVQDYIREEIMYREALVMGLDRDDPLIRRRMQQKLQFLTDDIATLNEPTETELRAFLDENADQFRSPARFSLQHVYFNANERGESVRADAESALTEIQNQEDAEARSQILVGDPLLMTPTQFEAADENEIARVMGVQFLDALRILPSGSWQGPIQSGFGLHLVYISEYIEGDLPPLDQIRNDVQREWDEERRREANDTFYNALRERYIVTIADPQQDVNASPELSETQ